MSDAQKTQNPILAVILAAFNIIIVAYLWYYLDYCTERYEILWSRFQAGQDINFWAPYRWLGLAILVMTGAIALIDFLVNKDSFILLLSLFFMFYGFLILTDLPKLIFNTRITFSAAHGPLHFYIISIISLSLFTVLTKFINKDVRQNISRKFKKKKPLQDDILDHFEEEEK